MLTSEDEVRVRIRKLSLLEVKEIKEMLQNGFVSIIGHESTAEVLSSLLGIAIPMNRSSIKLQKTDTLIVFQIRARLPEGKILSKEELENLPIEFFVVEIM
jgi:hypothetical protein